MRRAKIVCTIGPATSSPEKTRELVDAGMNVARINASHGTHADHEETYRNVRAAAEATGKAVAILVDLQGPKIRLGNFADGSVILRKGDEFTITTEDILGDKDMVSTTFKGLPGDCKPGDNILIDDGNIQVKVKDVVGPRVITEVLVGGPVSNHKGVNLPGVAVSVPALSEKDKIDLEWALNLGADLIALSFVRSAEDINDVHEVMDRVGRRLPVIAKIEKPQAVENLEGIVEAFDGLMVARGDLGVELPLEQVPTVQKRCIDLARRASKPVIVATQVLESMITNPRPTRAEASDCANAILDGADAVMLSGETSVGQYPIECVRVMGDIISYTEEHGMENIVPLNESLKTRNGVITRAALDIAEALDCRYAVTFTTSGLTARRMSRLRSPIPHLVFTPFEATRNTLALSWGVEAIIVPEVHHTDEMVEQVDQVLREHELVNEDERVVITSGMPPGTVGSTNSIRVHKIGETLPPRNS
ncbi:pyruvate kinase [Flaviflexus massiliensis]|uniref:pyruvate kinase n=1 Tax=Flaviflexus massiliensis TaxID=1522309 RepID=UPI0006D590F1|nr:pyruvate kinase [Flaviflexus massiliensis]